MPNPPAWATPVSILQDVYSVIVLDKEGQVWISGADYFGEYVGFTSQSLDIDPRLTNCSRAFQGTSYSNAVVFTATTLSPDMTTPIKAIYKSYRGQSTLYVEESGQVWAAGNPTPFYLGPTYGKYVPMVQWDAFTIADTTATCGTSPP